MAADNDLTELDLSRAPWRTSSYSGNGGNCVEVAAAGDIMVRDTKDRSAGTLRFTLSAWRAFLDDVR